MRRCGAVGGGWGHEGRQRSRGVRRIIIESFLRNLFLLPLASASAQVRVCLLPETRRRMEAGISAILVGIQLGIGKNGGDEWLAGSGFR